MCGLTKLTQIFICCEGGRAAGSLKADCCLSVQLSRKVGMLSLVITQPFFAEALCKPRPLYAAACPSVGILHLSLDAVKHVVEFDDLQ